MKWLLAMAVVVLASSAAHAQYQFEYGGKTIRIDPDRGTIQIPGVYDSAFQATGMKFPVAGCWQVTGRAGNKKLSYVLQVEP